MSAQANSLQTGLDALQQKDYPTAINHLVTWCQECDSCNSPDYLRAQMALVQAYRGDGQIPAAIALAEELSQHPSLETQEWARQVLKTLAHETPPPSKQFAKPKRAAGVGIRLALAGIAGNLAMASSVTIGLLFGMILVLILAIALILNSQHPGVGFVLAIAATLIVNGIMFFVAPWFMDLIQSWLYKTRWVALSEVAQRSPEAAEVIQRVCSQHNLKQPRLGIIDDENPTAFTYGSLPNSARLVVSQGLFTYLDDEEVATVYAHELGHIVHWDFAIMTLAAVLVQITYLIYVFARRIARGGDSDNKATAALQGIALAAYGFYILGTYLVLYLSRTREYYADHFAAEVTGNPNGLSRALVKIAYGILDVSERAQEPSRLVEGTRALGIYDPKAAYAAGTAYQLKGQGNAIGRVFLWDLFNPWAVWSELNSTHPLTGKRVRALSTYAEQLGIDSEFDMGRVVAEGKRLDKGRLYRNFALDIVLYGGEWLGLAIGLGIALVLFFSLQVQNWQVFAVWGLLGLGIGLLSKALVMYPSLHSATATTVLALMSDPYASPLRGQPVKLKGDLIGRGDAGYAFGSDLKLQDASGLMYLRYASRFGPLGNFFFGATKVKDLVGQSVTTQGWFRRDLMPWVDLAELRNANTTVTSHPRFWAIIYGVLAILAGFLILSLR